MLTLQRLVLIIGIDDRQNVILSGDRLTYIYSIDLTIVKTADFKLQVPILFRFYQS
ncbi:hypothetical protein [Chamaesiphon minutus]|uniref:Uncharacterized protein n=1 Tax=Chamaesiphon minutus (strain ATCC 27169 / PCC 6605) TaxID=1173020 RepID=K9UPF9_CHAP6|nr:hypothetical protein [Chamaesiphon minutus]AFY96286.1 hypothetical protein Cha6605_5399 [Chamaesiphon minutus PCC 6605]